MSSTGLIVFFLYWDRCTQIEKGTLNGLGLVFSTTGGMGTQATMFLKRVATLLAPKTGQDKCLVMANLRRRLRFELLKTVLVAVRGHRGRYYQKAIPVDELDLNLVHTTNDEENGDDVECRRCRRCRWWRGRGCRRVRRKMTRMWCWYRKTTRIIWFCIKDFILPTVLLNIYPSWHDTWLRTYLLNITNMSNVHVQCPSPFNFPYRLMYIVPRCQLCFFNLPGSVV